MADEADRMEERLDTLGDHIADAAKKADVPDRSTDSDIGEDAGLGEVIDGEDVAPGDEPTSGPPDR